MKIRHQLSLLALAGGALLSSCEKDREEPRQTFQLDEAKSTATWQGYLRTGYFNEGSLDVRSEQMTVQGGQVKSGTFVMPLASLKNFNLPDAQKLVLIHHLQSTDFFNMALHPNLRFAITQVTPYAGGDPTAIAGANYLVAGDLTLLDKTRPITFPAKIDLAATSLAVQADLRVDRTQWGLTYAADPALPDAQYILPEIKLHLDVQGKQQ